MDTPSTAPSARLLTKSHQHNRLTDQQYRTLTLPKKQDTSPLLTIPLNVLMDFFISIATLSFYRQDLLGFMILGTTTSLIVMFQVARKYTGGKLVHAPQEHITRNAACPGALKQPHMNDTVPFTGVRKKGHNSQLLVLFFLANPLALLTLLIAVVSKADTNKKDTNVDATVYHPAETTAFITLSTKAVCELIYSVKTLCEYHQALRLRIAQETRIKNSANQAATSHHGLL